MGGALWWNIINDDCTEIRMKLNQLKLDSSLNKE